MSGRAGIRQTLQAVLADLEDEEASNIVTLVAAEDYKWRVGMIYRNFLQKS